MLTVVSDTEIDATWEPFSEIEDGFSLTRSDDGGNNFNEIAELSDVVSYQDDELTQAKKYSYKVRSFIDDSIIRTKPTLISASVEEATPNHVEINFSQDIKTINVPSITAFSLPGKTITNISISGAKVTLTVSVAYVYGDSITVSYIVPLINTLKGKIGNVLVDPFTDYVVTNNCTATIPLFVSAAIANATPTKVILTYDQALDTGSVPTTGDFTVTDHTISGVAISGSTVELTLSTAIIYFDIVNVTYTKGANPIQGSIGGLDAANLASTSVTNNVLDDTNSVAWYKADDLTTITKDGSNLVARWNDKMGSGRDLLQGTATNKPLWNAAGITLDGVDNWIDATFTLIQPEFIYIVLKHLSWTDNDTIFDGMTANYGYLCQGYSANRFKAYAGTVSGNSADTDLNLDTLAIIRVCFNGASSKLQVNAAAAVTGNFNTRNMGGFSLGRPGGYNGQYGNFTVKEIIIRKSADSGATETAIYNTLKARHGL